MERKQRNKTKTEENEIQGNKKMILKREGERRGEREGLQSQRKNFVDLNVRLSHPLPSSSEDSVLFPPLPPPLAVALLISSLSFVLIPFLSSGPLIPARYTLTHPLHSNGHFSPLLLPFPLPSSRSCRSPTFSHIA